MAVPTMIALGVGVIAWSKHMQNSALNAPTLPRGMPSTAVYQPNQVIYGNQTQNLDRVGNSPHYNQVGFRAKKLNAPTLGLTKDLQTINPSLHCKEEVFKHTKAGMVGLNFARQLATPTHELLDEWFIGQKSHAGSGPLTKNNPTIQLNLTMSGPPTPEMLEAC